MPRCTGWTCPGSRRLAIREGTVGPQARSLGAAAIPLSQRYMIDQNSCLREV